MVQPSRIAGHHVLQHAARGVMEQHVVGDDSLDAGLGREVGKLVEAKLVARAAAQGQREVGVVAEDVRHATKLRGARRICHIRHQHADQALRIDRNVIPRQHAGALAAAFLAERQQSAQPAIGGAIGWIDQHGRAVGEVEPAADDEAHTRRFCCLVRADHAGEAAAVGDRQGVKAQLGGGGEQLLARARAAQEREVRGALKLSIAAHPNTPWMNQRCKPVARSSPSPSRNNQNRAPASSSTWK